MLIETDPDAVAAARREADLMDRAGLLPRAVQVLAPRVAASQRAATETVRVPTDALGALLSAATALAALAAPLYMELANGSGSRTAGTEPKAPREAVP